LALLFPADDHRVQAIQRLTADPRLSILQDVVPEARPQLRPFVVRHLIARAGCREEPSSRRGCGHMKLQKVKNKYGIPCAVFILCP
jgi:hypothetical protein